MDTAEKTVLLVRSELEQASSRANELEDELDDRTREVTRLAGQVVKLRAEVAVLRAEQAASTGFRS